MKKQAKLGRFLAIAVLGGIILLILLLVVFQWRGQAKVLAIRPAKSWVSEFWQNIVSELDVMAEKGELDKDTLKRIKELRKKEGNKWVKFLPEEIKKEYYRLYNINKAIRRFKKRLKALGFKDAEIEKMLREATSLPEQKQVLMDALREQRCLSGSFGWQIKFLEDYRDELSPDLLKKIEEFRKNGKAWDKLLPSNLRKKYFRYLHATSEWKVADFKKKLKDLFGFSDEEIEKILEGAISPLEQEKILQKTFETCDIERGLSKRIETGFFNIFPELERDLFTPIRGQMVQGWTRLGEIQKAVINAKADPEKIISNAKDALNKLLEDLNKGFSYSGLTGLRKLNDVIKNNPNKADKILFEFIKDNLGARATYNETTIIFHARKMTEGGLDSAMGRAVIRTIEDIDELLDEVKSLQRIAADETISFSDRMVRLRGFSSQKRSRSLACYFRKGSLSIFPRKETAFPRLRFPVTETTTNTCVPSEFRGRMAAFFEDEVMPSLINQDDLLKLETLSAEIEQLGGERENLDLEWDKLEKKLGEMSNVPKNKQTAEKLEDQIDEIVEKIDKISDALKAAEAKKTRLLKLAKMRISFANNLNDLIVGEPTTFETTVGPFKFSNLRQLNGRIGSLEARLAAIAKQRDKSANYLIDLWKEKDFGGMNQEDFEMFVSRRIAGLANAEREAVELSSEIKALKNFSRINRAFPWTEGIKLPECRMPAGSVCRGGSQTMGLTVINATKWYIYLYLIGAVIDAVVPTTEENFIQEIDGLKGRACSLGDRLSLALPGLAGECLKISDWGQIYPVGVFLKDIRWIIDNLDLLERNSESDRQSIYELRLELLTLLKSELESKEFYFELKLQGRGGEAVLLREKLPALISGLELELKTSLADRNVLKYGDDWFGAMSDSLLIEKLKEVKGSILMELYFLLSEENRARMERLLVVDKGLMAKFQKAYKLFIMEFISGLREKTDFTGEEITDEERDFVLESQQELFKELFGPYLREPDSGLEFWFKRRNK